MVTPRRRRGMERLTVGDIVLVRFPFSDLTAKKYRPALVVAEAELGDIIVCQITSKSYGKKNIIKIARRDLSGGSLPVESFARPDKLFTLSNQLVARKIGKISNEKIEETKVRLAQIFGLG